MLFMEIDNLQMDFFFAVSALQYTLDSVDLMIGITYIANKTHANFNPFTCS